MCTRALLDFSVFLHRAWPAERPVVAAAGTPFLLAAHARAKEIDLSTVRQLLRQRFDSEPSAISSSIAWREKHYPTDFVPSALLSSIIAADREYCTWDHILDPRAGNALLEDCVLTIKTNYCIRSAEGPRTEPSEPPNGEQKLAKQKSLILLQRIVLTKGVSCAHWRKDAHP